MTCKAWLEKLCGESTIGVENKRNRNIYLSNLVLCMQEGQLSPPFQIPPAEADLSSAREVFGLEAPKVTAVSVWALYPQAAVSAFVPRNQTGLTILWVMKMTTEITKVGRT